MIHKEKENIVFSKPQTIEDILDHFKNIDKKQIHTLNATFTSDIFIYEKLQQIFEDNLFKGQENLKRLKIRFDATPLAIQDIQSLSKLIVRLKTVRHLQLSFGFCNLSLQCLIPLVQGILDLQELKGLKLDLSGNPILSQYNYILRELMKVPSKYFKIKLCQCDLNILMFSTNSKESQQSSGYFLRECTSSIKQEYQKQGNQQILQNQHQSQVPMSQRQSRRSSANVNLKDDVSSESSKREFTQGSTFGIYDQKSDNLNSNSLHSMQENQGKMLFQNIQIDQSDQCKNVALIRSRLQSSSENKSNSQQNQMTNQTTLNPDCQQKALDQTENLSQRSQNIANIDGQEFQQGFENESQGQQESRNNKQCDAILKDFKTNYDQHFLNKQELESQEKNNNQKVNKQSQLQEVVDFRMDIEETDYQQQQKQQIENYEEEEEYQQYDNENKEEYDEEENQFTYKKGKFLKKSKKPSNDINTNVKTRSKLGVMTANKKDQKNNRVQQNNQKGESFKNNTTILTHSKTAGKGEAYFNRTYRGNNNTTHGGLSKMNTTGNETVNNTTIQDEIIEQNKTENLDTLVNSLQFQRQSSQQLFSTETQNSSQSYSAQLNFQNKQQGIQENQQSYIKESNFPCRTENDLNNQQQVNIIFQQSGRKYQKRVIDKIVLDLRSNQDLQQQSLKVLAVTLNDLFSQVNELHLKIPDSQDWNNLITLEFSTCLPIVLDMRIDPICFQKVAFTNMNKEIQTAFRKLKFGDRLKDNPNTQQIQEEIQNWFCPEKDFVCKKSLVKENYLQYQEMNQDLELLEFENFRYQQIFFNSSMHSFCNICQNQANELHYLQANTQGLYFCYSQEDILIQDFIEFLDKVQINLQNQYSQIFNEGEIRENLCSNQQLYLFQRFLKQEFTAFNGNQAIKDFNLQNSEQKISCKSEVNLMSTPVQTKNNNQLPQSMNKNEQIQEKYLNYSTPISKFQNSHIYQESHQQKQFQFIQTNHNKSTHMQSYYVSQDDFKYNNFHKKLERALKLKLIESVTMRFIFQEYYYEEQYELIQKIYNIIKIISQRININKLYLSVNQGISPLVLSQIIFVEELNIDLIETGSCMKDKNVFYINLRNPKFQILKSDLQIFAQIINSNASFEEIHINFDEKQIKCVQSITHLLTRYRQQINLKEQTLTIFRENLPPIQEFPSSVCEYLNIIDDSGNFNDKEEETVLVSYKGSQSPGIYDDLEQEEKSINSQNFCEKDIEETQLNTVINNHNTNNQQMQNEQQSMKNTEQNEDKQISEFKQGQIEIEKNSQTTQLEVQLIEQEQQQQQQIKIDETSNLSVSKKRERKRQPKKKADLNLEQKQFVQEKAISKKRNQDKDEKKQQKTKNQKQNAKSKKTKDNEKTIKNLNSESEQDQNSSLINQQQDDESKEGSTNLNCNQSNSPNNSNNSTNSKGDQYLSIKGKQQILKQDQNPQQLLY
ncbi:hypothetical protein ABPG74_003459 [Tetrahymena malaccensis]